MSIKIVLVEDDERIQKSVSAAFSEDGYQVFSCRGQIPFLERFLDLEIQGEGPDARADMCLFIFDVNLPDGNGFELCRLVRSKAPSAPIIMLTVLNDEDSIVYGLESGADDYISKPFSMRILKSRVKALIRRQAGTMDGGRIRSGDLLIDINHSEVYKGNLRLSLLPKEIQIVRYLTLSGGCLVSRNLLFEKIWDIDENFIDDNTLSVHMSRLRRKLGTWDGKPFIITERGFGYRWGVKIEKN